MQIFSLFRIGESHGRGTSIEVPEVTSSDLWALIKTKFQALREDPNVPGTPKLVQRLDNPDLFDLCFDAHRGGEHYEGNRRYFLPRTGTFSKQEFEQFPHAAATCEQRIDEFIQALQAGSLK